MSVTSNSIIDSPFKSKALFANFSMLIPLVSINNFYAGLEQTQGDKTALERNGLPTESVGSIAQNPDGRSDYLRRHCFRYQSPEGFSSGRDCRWRKSRGSPDTLPPCHPFHGRIGQLPLGRCTQDRHYRVGSGKEGAV